MQVKPTMGSQVVKIMYLNNVNVNIFLKLNEFEVCV